MKRIPNFFLVGAMKSGTTTVHRILESDQRIYIPRMEVGYFDFDEYFEHIDYFACANGGWINREFSDNDAQQWKWYQNHFVQAKPNQLLGEDSTTYLSSHNAAHRIARHQPNAKIIILLRDPASRAYSQYWHLFRTGRAPYTFDDTLRLMPDRILLRSKYADQIERYIRCFPRAQIHIELFERLAENPLEVMTGIYSFLGLEVNPSIINTQTHSNRAQTPRWIGLHRWRNKLRWRSELARYAKRLRGLGPNIPINSMPITKVFDALYKRINPLSTLKPPPYMTQATHTFLDKMLKHENRQLEQLTGLEINKYWYHSQHTVRSGQRHTDA